MTIHDVTHFIQQADDELEYHPLDEGQGREPWPERWHQLAYGPHDSTVPHTHVPPDGDAA